jgi:formylglycine-generating enzyme required for sulfatase activity
MGDIWRPGASAAAQPIHEVVLSSFCMHRSEITVAHYIRFLNECELVTSLPGTVAGTRVFIGCGDTLLSAPVQADSLSGALIVPPDTAAYPVTGVSWTGAALFCNWLSEQDGLKACYDTSDWSLDSTANGYRLPTEAEFEYAHSAAFLSTKQRYPWGYGDDPRRYGSLASGLHAIGFFGPFNGLYDMSGNALEWCHDFSDASAPPDSSYYAYCQSRGVVFDPMGPPGGERHVLRGGSYLQNGDMCSSVYRHTAEDAPWSGCGFRVVRRIP